MAYRFRLESVLNYRRNLEELAQQQLGREQLALDGHLRQLAEFEAEFARLVEELEGRKQKPVPAPLYMLYRQAIDRKEADIARQHRVIEAQKKKVEQARTLLMERVKARKVMEKARERDQEKHLQNELRKEQNASDEQMVLRFGRHGQRLPR